MKEENPHYSICEVAKELGRRWAEMDPQVKQRYQARAEEERQKYDNDMANYRQGNLAAATAANNAAAGAVAGAGSPAAGASPSYTVQQQAQTADYANLLQ